MSCVTSSTSRGPRLSQAHVVVLFHLILTLAPFLHGPLGCGQDPPLSMSDAEIDAQREQDGADAPPSPDLADEPDGIAEDSDNHGEPCLPGAPVCVRGVVATCETDGLWHFDACPAGQICEGGECTGNVQNVVVVANSPLPQVMPMPPALPDSLLDMLRAEGCAAFEACCESMEATLSENGNVATAIAAKYWIRRLVFDLSEVPRVRMSLLGPPRAEMSFEAEASCVEQTRLQAEACIGGSNPLIPRVQLDELIRASYPESVRPSPSGLPAWELNGATTSALDTLIDLTARTELSSDTSMLFDWVDGRMHDDDGSEAELNTSLASGYPMPFLAFVYLALHSARSGTPCTADLDCTDLPRRCERGRCADPAASCRLWDVVFVGPFAHTLDANWSNNQCIGGPSHGVDHNVWSQWMKWGVGCSKEEPCWSDSACVDVCRYYESEPCSGPSVCLPHALASATDDPVVRRMLSDFVSFFPSVHPRDALGRRISVTSHAIFIGASPNDLYEHGFGPVEHATATAVAGGGVAVTPCAPDVDIDAHPEWNSSTYVSCDYEARYAEMIEEIAARQGTAVCSPEAVGLPDFAHSLPAE